jgi:hypothetical protein
MTLGTFNPVSIIMVYFFKITRKFTCPTLAGLGGSARGGPHLHAVECPGAPHRAARPRAGGRASATGQQSRSASYVDCYPNSTDGGKDESAYELPSETGVFTAWAADKATPAPLAPCCYGRILPPRRPCLLPVELGCPQAVRCFARERD